nr:histidine kinase [uncultured Lichenicoccus sp.]
MSTQMLFQAFVWRNWSAADILVAWLAIARDRLVVALMIAAMLVALGRSPRPDAGGQVGRTVLAVLLGAAMGELALVVLGIDDDREDLMSIIGRVLRWGVLGGAAATMVQLWRSRTDLAAQANETRIEEAQARRLAASVQTEVLQRQIEPHFLFNTLATIRSLRDSDPEQGQHLLSRLLDYMSSTLSCVDGRRTTLGEEIELVLAYLDLCASRMHGRLTVRCDAAAEVTGYSLPPLMLATLAENAIKHGIFPRQQGSITIEAGVRGGMFEVALTDDGVGLTGEMGHGLGLTNIAERLRLIYGPAAQLRLLAQSPRGTRAVVSIPEAAACS